MKIIDKMPEEGQFIAVWVAYGKPFADTLRHSSAGLIVLKSHGWAPNEVGPDAYEEVGARYLVVEE